MTAYIAFANRAGASLLSDAATVDTAGRVVEFVSKPCLFSDLGLALALTGRMEPGTLHTDMTDAAPATLDEALSLVPCIAHSMAGRNKSNGERDPDVMMLAVCWHADRGGALFVTATGAVARTQGWRPGQMHRLSAWLGSCDDPGAILGRPIELRDLSSLDPATDGLALMMHERQATADPTLWRGLRGLHLVGGYVERTSIGPAGIKQQRLREWPEDRVGRRIMPGRMAA